MALDPLAEIADLSARLGRSMTSTEAARAEALLRDASAAVRSYTGRQISAGDTTVRLRPDHKGRVRLNQRPVTAITHVKSINPTTGAVSAAIAGFMWDGLLDITIPLPSQVINGPDIPDERYKVIEIRYTHGYAPVPDDIVAVVCSMALRALGVDPGDTGKTSESIAGYSYSIGAAAAAGGVGMLEGEKVVLDRWKGAPTPISTRPA